MIRGAHSLDPSAVHPAITGWKRPSKGTTNNNNDYLVNNDSFACNRLNRTTEGRTRWILVLESRVFARHTRRKSSHAGFSRVSCLQPTAKPWKPPSNVLRH